MNHRNIKSKAVLIGFTSDGKCVYSDSIALEDYWDGEHVWDNHKLVKRLRLALLKGFLFDSRGNLLQEFESLFDSTSGVYSKGWIRHADGTVQRHV